MRLTFAWLGWVLDLSLGREDTTPEPEHVADLGADRTMVVPDFPAGLDGFGMR